MKGERERGREEGREGGRKAEWEGEIEAGRGMLARFVKRH